VPDGLDGMRVDAGLSRLLGLSRTAAAALTEDGRVAVDGRAAGKSDRLTAGAWLEVQLPDPEPVTPITGPEEVVAGLTVLHADDEIIVVDKPVGVAAHPSPAGPAPPCWAGSPRSATASPPRVRPSGRASSTGWTSAPPA
jgi:23S rRNA pseudouridine1911/1915/1917 synthase